MRALLSHLIMPYTIFWIIVAAAVVLFIRRKKRLAVRLSGAGLIWLLMISTPFIPGFLVSELEKNYSSIDITQLQQPGKPVYIVVLGAGYTNDKRLPANSKLSGSTLIRLAEGIRIHRQVPGSILVTSATGSKEEISQAEVTAHTALLLGVEREDILMMKNPRNTYMEATEFKRLFGDTVQPVVVTSAVHMPRAMYLFRKAGLRPIAAPADFKVKKDDNTDFWFWLPSAGNIRKMERAVHEYAGMMWYGLGGR